MWYTLYYVSSHFASLIYTPWPAITETFAIQ
jgi:hypothetical protein